MNKQINKQITNKQTNKQITHLGSKRYKLIIILLIIIIQCAHVFTVTNQPIDGGEMFTLG